MKLKLTAVLIALLLVPTFGYAKKRTCPPQKPTCGTSAIGDCRNEGCGGDAEMNKRKNIKTAASSAEWYTRSDFVKLIFPEKWKAGSKRMVGIRRIEWWGSEPLPTSGPGAVLRDVVKEMERLNIGFSFHTHPLLHLPPGV